MATAGDARAVFHSLPSPNLLSWNIIISACAANGDFFEAMRLFHATELGHIGETRCKRKRFLPRCARGMSGLERDDRGGSGQGALRSDGPPVLELLGHAASGVCGRWIRGARQGSVRSDVPGRGSPWTLMIQEFAQSWHFENAKDIFTHMAQSDQMPKTGILDARKSCLIACPKALSSSCPLRLNAGKRYSWTALATVNAHAGHHAAVQLLFTSMLLDGIKPDELTFVCLLSSVAYTGILDEVRERFMAMVADNFVAALLLPHRSAGEGGEAG
ncbi:pentatricopeptide repeat-containing protein At1g03540-like [Selaginella moellendorffii]|uniref:pentatricopeptide repeat-containing protein At1g03540-like n=1 Tax=Selaginella moellendorffii TaxID=88036 RepID=UPI000D1CA3BA|nr:pentatricopeptide repeat-containing protein At1g03540-like [Selaginella moellendorffii]|eukprot:XP_024532798.1 pentatricopeptide repeat-containing protein At1g03540-like [Selaginella moellendorffii]